LLPPVTVDWSLNVGNLLVYMAAAGLGLWRVYALIDRQLAVFQNILSSHAETLTTHAGRMDRHEERLIAIVGDLKHVMGVIEGQNRSGRLVK
jgi:hypothetical protein